MYTEKFTFNETLGAIDKVERTGTVARVHFNGMANMAKVIHLCVTQRGNGKTLKQDSLSAILLESDALFSQTVELLEEEKTIAINLDPETALLELFYVGELNKKFKRTFFLR